MRWRGQAGSKNVEDRRGVRGRTVAGGGGILAVILVVAFTLLRGGDMQQALNVGVQEAQRQAVQARLNPGDQVARSPEEDEQAEFASVVFRFTEEVWDELLPAELGRRYEQPRLRLYTGYTDSGCGNASSAVGPFYCPADNRVYLDLGFFEELRSRFKAPGDFACAYVIAHEVGHHIQNLLGLSMKVQSLQSQMSEPEANELSVRLELQADFLAGVWAHHAQNKFSILERGDIEEALRAAQQIGDDTLQRNATGHVVPDSFTHGTSAQRMRWFRRGIETGKLADMNLTFELDYADL